MDRSSRPPGRRSFWLAVNAAAIAAIAWQAWRWNEPYDALPAHAYDYVNVYRGPQVGDAAPNFQLITKQGDRQVTLSDFRGRKPVVLVFGSYTCPIFRSHWEALNAEYEKLKDQAEFLFVYIREAHPEDGGRIPENEPLGEPIFEAKRVEDRMQAAQTCAAQLNIQMPILLDNMDNQTATAYHAWPERMYVVDAQGKVAYCGNGPGDMNVPEMTAALKTLIGEEYSRLSLRKSRATFAERKATK